MTYLGLAPKASVSNAKDVSQEAAVTVENSTSDEAKKLAAAALAAIKDDAIMPASGRGKVMVSTLLFRFICFSWSIYYIVFMGEHVQYSAKVRYSLYVLI